MAVRLRISKPPAAAEEATEPHAEEEAIKRWPPPRAGAKATPSIIVTEPVRSGQSLFFPEGDVTVVGSVASGAEIVAGGSIHIYGTLGDGRWPARPETPRRGFSAASSKRS